MHMAFSTSDRDNDLWPDNCADFFKGGWWYKDCHTSKLTGIYGLNNYAFAEGIGWLTFTGDWETASNLAYADLKIRQNGA